jgi:hypothetical protein
VRELLLKTDYYNVDPALMSLHDRLENVVMGLEALKVWQLLCSSSQ